MATRPLRVNVFANGELSGGKALLVPTSWGEFVEAVGNKVKAGRRPVRVFTAEGGEVSELDELLAEDRLFVVEHGDDFRTPGSGPAPPSAPHSADPAEETEPIDLSQPSSSAQKADANSAASAIAATPPPLAHPPRSVLPLHTGSSAETRRHIFRQQEPQLLRLQSLMPGVAFSEVLVALSIAQNHMPTALSLLADAHPSLTPPTAMELDVAALRSRQRFDASLLSKTPAAPRVRARADFGPVEQNVRDVVGPRFSQAEIRNAVRAANGNAENAILQLLNQDIP